VNTELPIGVCSWCIDRHDVCRGIEVAGRELGLRFAQIGFFSEHDAQTADAAAIIEAKCDANVSLVSSFVAFEGEDYASIARITATGGFMPDDESESRLALTSRVALVAALVGCTSVSVHHGTIPSDETSPNYDTLLTRVRTAADYAEEVGLRLLLETGREPADVLLRFIDAADRINIGVNFDPGNFIIYGTDEPAATVTKLKDRIELVHLKDAFRSARPGVDYGRPFKDPLAPTLKGVGADFGAGDVQIARVISKLRATGYGGPLLIECDTRETGLDAIRNAADYLRTMLS
jgi:sugar phosphate isomerase/epimerase